MMMMMIRIKEIRSLDDWGESFSRLTSKKETREFVCRHRKVDGWTLSCYAAVDWVSFLFLVLGARVLSQESSFGWFFSSVRPISCCRYVGNHSLEEDRSLALMLRFILTSMVLSARRLHQSSGKKASE